ncbi:MAG: porin [Alphaproteobacteria bacterium]|nr:porin [Alphaproteobacteria bacterium]
MLEGVIIMLSSKKKVVSLVAGGLLLASAASAEVKFSGGAELDLFYRTNLTPVLTSGAIKTADATTKARGGFGQEAAIVLNVDGTHEGNDVFKSFDWRIAGKAATDYRYDPLGVREAWIGTTTDFGKFRGGNQFSNLYLVLDGVYSPYGSGNMMGDTGAHEVQYSRALTYISPVFSGFQFSAQYDMGASKNREYLDANGNTQNNILTSYAYETVLTYDSDYFRIDAGYNRGVNSGAIDPEADVFGGNKGNMSWGYGTNDNLSEQYFLGTVFKAAGASFKLGYSHSHFKGWDKTDAPIDGGIDMLSNRQSDIRVNKLLASVGYTYEKHTMGIGYVKAFDSRFFDGEEVLKDNKDGSNSYYGQYTYALNDAVSVFGQARMTSYNTRGGALWATDGTGASNVKNSTRILVGTYIAF